MRVSTPEGSTSFSQDAGGCGPDQRLGFKEETTLWEAQGSVQTPFYLISSFPDFFSRTFLGPWKVSRSLGAQLCTILYCVSECITPWQDILQGLGSVIIVGVDAVSVHNVGHI